MPAILLAAIKLIKVGTLLFGIDVTEDGNLLYVANAGEEKVSFIYVPQLRLLRTIPVGQTPFSGGLFITNDIPLSVQVPPWANGI